MSYAKYNRCIVAQSVKNLPAMQETWVRFLGWEDPLKNEMETHSSILARRIPWTEPGRLQSNGITRVGHEILTKSPPRIHVFKDISSMVQERNVLLNQKRPKYS